MGLSLHEIEEKAQQEASHLLGTPSRATADLHRAKLKGLRDLALIMQVADNRATWNAQVGMRERELAAMETAADAQSALVSRQPERRCGAVHPKVVFGEPMERTVELQCLLIDGHAALHKDREGTQWDEVAEPTKPAAEQLHALVSYLTTLADSAHNKLRPDSDSYKCGSADGHAAAYRDAATKLQEILQEGGI